MIVTINHDAPGRMRLSEILSLGRTLCACADTAARSALLGDFVERCACENLFETYGGESPDAERWIADTANRCAERARSCGYCDREYAALLRDCAQWIESDRANADAWLLLALAGSVGGDAELRMLGNKMSDMLKRCNPPLRRERIDAEKRGVAHRVHSV